MNSIDVSKIKLSQLRAFVAVAATGNFSEAAASLNLTQSSISHAIATLENELGVVLFNRGRQGASLTHVGNQIKNQVQQVLQILDGVAEQAMSARGLQTGQVRVVSIRSLATHWLPPMMALFHQQFPQINVTLTKVFNYVGLTEKVFSGDFE